LKEFGGPFQNRISELSASFDIKCINSIQRDGNKIKIIQAKLFSKSEYFGSYLSQSLSSDELMVIELNLLTFTSNFIQKGGTSFDTN
jgi:hypothetical protein